MCPKEVLAMSRLLSALCLILLLAACQPQILTATSVPSADIPVGTVPQPGSNQLSSASTAAAPTATSTPSGPVIHRSSSDPNASNLLVVRDQSIVNNSLTIDSVMASQAGWLVIYLDKRGNFGPMVVFTPVPAGKSSPFVIPLNQNLNPIFVLSNLPGSEVHLVLQAGAPAPGTPVRENGKLVWVMFSVLVTPKPPKP